MPVHLNRIYTRTGDDGTTALGDLSRASKNEPRLVAYGTCDEANAAIGAALATAHYAGEIPPAIAAVLRQVQNDLLDVGSDLSRPLEPDVDAGGRRKRIGRERIGVDYVERLEKWCDEFGEPLPPLRSFILPGGTPLAAQLHVARTVVRRAERAAWLAVDADPNGTSVLPAKYLNRLSDLLFIVGRAANPDGDILWVPGESSTDSEGSSES